MKDLTGLTGKEWLDAWESNNAEEVRIGRERYGDAYDYMVHLAVQKMDEEEAANNLLKSAINDMRLAEEKKRNKRWKEDD